MAAPEALKPMPGAGTTTSLANQTQSNPHLGNFLSGFRQLVIRDFLLWIIMALFLPLEDNWHSFARITGALLLYQSCGILMSEGRDKWISFFRLLSGGQPSFEQISTTAALRFLSHAYHALLIPIGGHNGSLIPGRMSGNCFKGGFNPLNDFIPHEITCKNTRK